MGCLPARLAGSAPDDKVLRDLVLDAQARRTGYAYLDPDLGRIMQLRVRSAASNKEAEREMADCLAFLSPPARSPNVGNELAKCRTNRGVDSPQVTFLSVQRRRSAAGAAGPLKRLVRPCSRAKTAGWNERRGVISVPRQRPKPPCVRAWRRSCSAHHH